ncbi:ABC transporter substrate-binding protein [Arthrobacter sp. RAF14]|uniref:ABC transporter substrate-binding protein n=1 Tax=Arthrobacter sp. RAF14 TaxID=3233051 RepID=UPI003F9055C7
MERRQVLQLLAASGLSITSLAAGAAAPANAAAPAGKRQALTGTASCLGPATEGSQPLPQETAELEHLYRKALQAGGKLTIWAGGDAPNQQDTLKGKLQKRFPDLEITLQVRLSKEHDVEIDKRIAEGGVLPDVTMLQTSHDFENWKAQDRLLPFKPLGVRQQFPGYADPDGAFLAANMYAFFPMYAKDGVDGSPSAYPDFLQPQYKEHLILTFPHDDDAVLYVYDKMIKQYGEDFLDQLAAQKPHFVRGTAAPAVMVGTRGYLGNLTGRTARANEPSRSYIPGKDWFISWTQRAAVFRDAPNTDAGKLFLAYVASKEYQSSYGGWRTRKDLTPPAGMQPLSSYGNTDPLDFLAWMRDRQHIDALKERMASVFGPVTGESPLTDPELLAILGLG